VLAASLLVLTARERVSPVVLDGESKVETERGASVKLSRYEVPSPRYVCGTTVPEPDVSSVGTAEPVSIPRALRMVSDEDEDMYNVEGSPVVRAPEVKNVSSDADADVSVEGRARELPARAPGGGVTMTSRRSVGPLETVTGDPSPMRDKPKPNPGRASLARRSADSNSSPRSVIEDVRRRELLRLGAITRGSPG
jgi:hypothetical protein